MENMETKNENVLYYIFKNGDIYKTVDCVNFEKITLQEYDYLTSSIHTGFNSFEEYKTWKSLTNKIFEITAGDDL